MDDRGRGAGSASDAPRSFLASNAYYNGFWYPVIGRRRVRWAKSTEWGRLFDQY